MQRSAYDRRCPRGSGRSGTTIRPQGCAAGRKISGNNAARPRCAAAARPGAHPPAGDSQRRLRAGTARRIHRPPRPGPRAAHRRGADGQRRRRLRCDRDDHRRGQRLRSAAHRGRRDLHIDHGFLLPGHRPAADHLAAGGPQPVHRLHPAHRRRRPAAADHRQRADRRRGLCRTGPDHDRAAPVPALGSDAVLGGYGRLAGRAARRW